MLCIRDIVDIDAEELAYECSGKIATGNNTLNEKLS